VRASALAYATLLAIIPMLAVVMSITTSFLKESGVERIDHFIVKFVASVTPRAMVQNNAQEQSTNTPGVAAEQKNLPAFAKEQEAVKARKEIAHRIHEFIQNTQSGALGITGAVALIFAAISMLGQIESTFNDIWGVPRGRSWYTRTVLYWAMLSLAPLMLTVALGLTTGPHLTGTTKLLMRMPFLGHLIFQLLPVLLLSLTFGLLYLVMPNTKVHWGAALAGGLVAGALWHLNSLLNVLYVSRVVSNFKIYGSLGLVPVFMIGLYFAWVIVLFGAQVAYAAQNRATYLEEKKIEIITERERELVAMRVMARIGRRFQHGELPPTVIALGKELGVPSRLIQQLIRPLCAARLVVETYLPEPAYLPARPLDTITCHDILLAIRSGHQTLSISQQRPAQSGVSGEFQRIEDAQRQAASAVTLQTLADRVQMPRPLEMEESASLKTVAGQDQVTADRTFIE
jgi:membrane protein